MNLDLTRVLFGGAARIDSTLPPTPKPIYSNPNTHFSSLQLNPKEISIETYKRDAYLRFVVEMSELESIEIE